MADKQTETDASVSTFISSLVFSVGVSTGLYIVYAVVRRRFPRVYQPRSYLGPAKLRPPDSNARGGKVAGMLGWIFGGRMLNAHGVIDRCGMDAYMFLEFLNKSFFLFLVLMCLAVPILIPLNVVNQRGLPGLNQLTIGNILDTKRLWAHLILTALFSILVLWGCMRAIRNYIQRRQEYLMSTNRAQSLQATTILVCGIPERDCNVPRLQEIFGVLPGGIKRIWLAYRPGELEQEVTERIALTNKLEGAECDLLRRKLKHHSADNANRRRSRMSTTSQDMLRNSQGINNDNHNTVTSMDETFPFESRPKHRPAKFPMSLFASCCGPEKVDSITVYRSELSNLNASILARQQASMAAIHDNDKENRMNAAFIQFHHQMAAHLAAQAVVHPKMLSMAPRLLEVHPKDVLWDNLGMDLTTRNVRKAIAMLLATALIVFWSIPVTFVASIAKLDAIVQFAPFLSGVYSLPTFVVGIIQGLLPPIGLAILMAILPIILYKLAHLGGVVLGINKTHNVMTSYHWFSVVHVLLVTTLANGIFAAVERIKENPSAIMEMLASSLPEASTFFLSFILMAWIRVPMMLLQIGPLIMYFVGKFLAKTPRKVYANESSFPSVDWGMTVPGHTIAFAIGLLYSTIQPLILPLVTVYFGLFYLAYRHMFLNVYHQPLESGGLIFPRIIDQVYIALTIYQLTMLGLFILQKDIAMSIIGFVILVGSLLAITISRSKVFKPLIQYLPMEMFDRQSLANITAATTPASASSRSGRGGFGAGGVGPGNLRIQTDPATILESDINPISRPESFHEKAPYKDPSSPSVERTSVELYSPQESRPARRFSLPLQRGGGDHGANVGLGTDGNVQTTHGPVSSEIPSIRVENAAPATAPATEATDTKGFGTQAGGVSTSSEHIQEGSVSDYHHHPQSTRSFDSRGADASLTHGAPAMPLHQQQQRQGGGGHLRTQDYSEDASLKVLGGGHPSMRSATNAIADRTMQEQYAYVHPALWMAGQPIWLPEDPRGFTEMETLELGNAGLPSTTEAATMDAKGKVSVDAARRTVAPGDLDWNI